MILSMCDKPEVLNTLRIIKTIINITMIVIPMLIIIMLMINLYKAITSGNKNTDTIKSSIIKGLIALFIFFIPTFINYFVTLIPDTKDFKTCFEDATLEKIDLAWQRDAEYYIGLAKKTKDKVNILEAKDKIANIKDKRVRNKLNKMLGYIEDNVKLVNEINEIVTKAELSLLKEDIDNALARVKEIKDLSIRKDYEKRLAYAKKRMNEVHDATDADYGTGVWEYKKGLTSLPFAIYVPEKAKNATVPLLVYLHGAGERSSSSKALINSGLLKVVANWKDTGLKNIPAIIVAPHLQSKDHWNTKYNINSVEEIINYVFQNYSINKSKVVLSGFSIGGSGVIVISGAKQHLFSALVIMSGYHSRTKPYEEYYRKMPIKGFSDPLNQEYMQSFMSKSNHLNDYRALRCGHGSVPKLVFEEDANKDGISDIVLWMLSHTKK